MRNWVNCKGLKLLLLIRMSDCWLFVNFGLKVIFLILFEINFRLFKFNNNFFCVGEIGVKWVFKLLIFWILFVFDRLIWNSLIIFLVFREKDFFRFKRWVLFNVINFIKLLIFKIFELLDLEVIGFVIYKNFFFGLFLIKLYCKIL